MGEGPFPAGLASLRGRLLRLAEYSRLLASALDNLKNLCD
jgi:hypothetical protein